jgi:hypothetical protein
MVEFQPLESLGRSILYCDVIMDELRIIAEYSNHPEAELAVKLLASHGIRSVTRSDDCGGVAGGQTFILGVQLLVSTKESGRAKEILNMD